MSSRIPSVLASVTALLAVGVLWACSDSVVEIGSELELELDAPATSALSDSVSVAFEARGRSLLGFVLRYGDGSVDSVRLSGSQSAGGQLRHLYQETGTYTLVGEVQDGIEGNIMAEVTLTVTN